MCWQVDWKQLCVCHSVMRTNLVWRSPLASWRPDHWKCDMDLVTLPDGHIVRISEDCTDLVRGCGANPWRFSSRMKRWSASRV